MDDPRSLFDIWLLALTCAAAIFDARSGLIPNWLTLPSLALAPLAHALSGPGALGWSIASALLCAAAPVALFCRGAMGGGDVKLFAASGAIAGASAGLELQLAGYVLAACVALGSLALRGELWAVLRRASSMLVGWASARRARSETRDPSTLASVRLGVPVFVACAALIAIRRLGL